MKKKGILLLLILNLSLVFAEEDNPALSYSFRYLLDNDETKSSISSWTISDELNKQDQYVYIAGNCDYLKTDTAFLKVNLLNCGFSTEVDSIPLSMVFKIDCAQSEKLSLYKDDVEKLYQDDISHNFGFISCTIHTPVSIKPYFLIDTINSSEGSWYFFNGRMSGTLSKATGLELSFRNHTLSALSGSSSIDMLDNHDDTILGNAGLHFLSANYSLSYAAGNWQFSSGFGYIEASTETAVSLTSRNQKYTFFPFKYINYGITGNADFLTIMQKCAFTSGKSRFTMDFSGLLCFQSEFTRIADWKFKTSMFFDGSTGETAKKFNFLMNTGIIISELAYQHVFATGNKQLALSVSKPFLLPFRFSKPDISDSGTEEEPLPFDFDLDISVSPEDIWKTPLQYILSGMAFSIRLNY